MGMWKEREQMGGWHRYEGNVELLTNSYWGNSEKFYYKIIAPDWMLRSSGELNSIEDARQAADKMFTCIILD